jgi:hypothetical protein
MKINTNNKEKLNAAIKEAEGPRASTRTINADDIRTMVETIEKRLSSMLLKRDWKGLRFYCDPHAQSFPASYNGTPESTQFMLERGTSGWFVTGIERSRCDGPRGYIKPINLNTKATELVDYATSHAPWTE